VGGLSRIECKSSKIVSVRILSKLFKTKYNIQMNMVFDGREKGELGTRLSDKRTRISCPLGWVISFEYPLQCISKMT